MSEKRRGLLKNPILRSFAGFRGNQRICLYTEPLYGIPSNLFTPLAAVYMAALGLSPFMIGLVTSVSLISQTLAAAVAGVFTDKLGRRNATVMSEVIAWIIPCILWATAQGPAGMLLAAMFNGSRRISETSWGLLVTEDYPADKMIHIYAITNIAGLLAGFVSPLAYLFVREFSLVTAMRWLYGVTAVTVSIRTLLIYRYAKETSVGLRRMRESKGVSTIRHLLDSRFVLYDMFKLRHIMLTVALVACFIMIRSVNDNFLPLLLTKKLGIPDENLSIFNTIRTLVMLVFYFILVPKLDVRRFVRPMIAAMLLLIAADLSFFALNSGIMPIIVVNLLLEAAALAIMNPMIATLRLQVMEKEERARMFAFTSMLAMLVTAPFGAGVGFLSEIDRSLPMLFNIGIALLAILITLKLHDDLRHRKIL